MNHFHYPEGGNLDGLKNYLYFCKSFSNFSNKMIRKLNMNFRKIIKNSKQSIIWCIK